MRRVLAVAFVALLCAGCGAGSPSASRTPLTERQRDSVIATEKNLPGSSVVGRAMTLSDREAARAKATNASVDSLFH
ncbi:MAG: hypothetical protein E6K81_12925 [Candidatus Eisenbacteria bacterium]|uniref:Uncharacterized protein n=1 Tax=Eiseniibacteriota bacterium TaxID=2212470 RepID=A0A538U383_UNCEI|nr:MAG: hypothetical protein E6K81_12925 [Candidatus Eisenbacteria bacterium]